MLCAFGHPVATCCNMLAVVGSNLKKVIFFMQHFWMLHDVGIVWPGSSNNVAQNVATALPNAYNMLLPMMLRSVTMVWPELANAGPTMLGYAAFRFCYRLAGPIQMTMAC